MSRRIEQQYRKMASSNSLILPTPSRDQPATSNKLQTQQPTNPGLPRKPFNIENNNGVGPVACHQLHKPLRSLQRQVYLYPRAAGTARHTAIRSHGSSLFRRWCKTSVFWWYLRHKRGLLWKQAPNKAHRAYGDERGGGHGS